MVNASRNIRVESGVQVSEYESLFRKFGLVIVRPHFGLVCLHILIIVLAPDLPHVFSAHSRITHPFGFHFVPCSHVWNVIEEPFAMLLLTEQVVLLNNDSRELR